MRNLLDETPTGELHGRLAVSRDFVGAKVGDGADVLDIGCGYGWFEHFALSNGAGSIVGVEPTEDDLATARAWIQDDRASFQVVGATALPFADASFDIVVMWEVLEHLPRQSEPTAFAEVARVLRPGGRLFLSTPHATAITQLTDPARWLIGHRHYSAGAVRALSQNAGLSVSRLELRGGPWEIVHMNVMYVSKWIFRRRPFFEKKLVARSDLEWQRPSGFVHVFLEAQKPA
jgi:2-polyprenyl-3-methyl-5-hydroxy-6-metoxy-1,4-benzoquinol methylase